MKLIQNLFVYKKTTFTVITINVLVFVGVILLFPKLPPVVPLFYGNPAGKEQLSPVTGLLIPPGFVLMVILMNTIISKISDDKFIHAFLTVVSVIFTILSTITVTKIILLVGSF